MREVYATIISLIQQQNNLRTAILDMENKDYDIRQKLSNSDAKRMMDELNEVKRDNEQLANQLKALNTTKKP